MEPDEIGVVLARASELHAKISEAIERTLKADFLHSTGGKSNGDAREILSSSPPSGRYGGVIEGYEYSGSVGNASAEARSLGSIRDALEVLEEQLEALQSVHLQQKSVRDDALAALEESRRTLLKRLKDHRGREWEVVREALAFAGEPVEDRDDLRLPPYPQPLPDYSSTEDQSSQYHAQSPSKYNVALRNLYSSAGQVEGAGNRVYAGESGSGEENQEENPGAGAAYQRKNEGRLLGMTLGFARSLLVQAYALTTKAGIAVACVVAALVVTELGQSIEKRSATYDVAAKRPPAPPPIATVRQMPPMRECPSGKKLIVEDGYPLCVVKERVELPFPKEISTPDVLYGRG